MKKNSTLMIVQEEYKKILSWLRDGQLLNAMDANLIQKLKDELAKAKQIDSSKAPSTLVRLNSTVTVLESGKDKSVTFTIVAPGQASIAERKVSVLAPIATAVLGYQEGDTFEWEMPTGYKFFNIVSVKNPQD
jgi:regulator of nucleoside diphosphate kinase